MFWMLPAIGAVGGAVMNKKNPLAGAAMGGLLGAGAGAGLGAMGGSLGSGAAMGGQQAAMLKAQEAGLGAAMTGWGGATTGLQGAANSMGMPNLISNSKGLLDAAGPAMGVANSIKGMMPQDQPLPQAPAFTSGGGNATIMAPYDRQKMMRQANRYNLFSR